LEVASSFLDRNNILGYWEGLALDVRQVSQAVQNPRAIRRPTESLDMLVYGDYGANTMILKLFSLLTRS
jgi:hypothetical protein